jgi:hypothetical protein
MEQPARTGLSKDLRPIFDLEIELGNEVAYVAEPAGTECPYAVSFKQPLHLQPIYERLKLPAEIKFWESRDPHYEIEAGFSSSASRHTVSGPIEEGSDSEKWLKMFVGR